MGPKLDRTRRGAVDTASTHTHRAMPYRWRGAVDPPEEGEDAANAHLCRPAKVAAGDDVGDVVPEAVPAAAAAAAVLDAGVSAHAGDEQGCCCHRRRCAQEDGSFHRGGDAWYLVPFGENVEGVISCRRRCC